MLEWCKALLRFKTKGKKARISQSRNWAEPIARQSTTTKERSKKKKKTVPEEQGNKTSVPQCWGKGLQPSQTQVDCVRMTMQLLFQLQG